MCWGCAGGLCLVFVFSLVLGRHSKNEVDVQATPESIISFSAAAGDGLQSTRSGLPRRKATRARDLLT